jgi:hypothetical protein
MIFGFDTAGFIAKGIVLAGLATCPGAPRNIDVDVQFDHVEAPYVKNLSAQQLTSNFEFDPDSTIATEKGLWQVAGMNQSRFKWQYKLDYQQFADKKSNQLCFAPKKITFYLTYENTIYIASDSVQKGCRYSVTKAHEERHVDMDLRVSRQYLGKIKQAMSRGTNGIRYLVYSENTAKQSVDAFLAPIQAQVDPVLEQMKQERRQKQATIDTPEMYRRDTALCPGQ